MSQEPPILRASELRQIMVDAEMRKLEELQRKRAKAEEALREFAQHFTHDSLSEEEKEEIRTKCRHAFENGQMEAMVMRFPSSLCADHGRAVNNALDHWPETLPGKARELYEYWLEVGKPAGYRLKSYIVDFPDGKPGDVGMFITWAE